MISLLSHRYAIAATMASLILVYLYNQPILNMIMLLVTAMAWYYELYNAKRDNREVINIVKRVHKLKKFSAELQQMVNTELGLVQEDVIRIRGIVSDSIVILQESVNNISETIAAKDQQGAQLSNTQQNLQNAAKEIAHTEEVIHAIHKFSEQIQLLANNFSMQAQKASNDIKSTAFDTKTCDDISQKTQVLQKELSASSTMMHHAMGEVRLASSHYNSYSNSNNLTEAISQNTSDIIRALQFEDIVCQISERVASHIGDIRILVDQLSHLYENELSTTFEEDLQSAREKMENIKGKLSKESAKVIVSQKNMDEGDIELF